MSASSTEWFGSWFDSPYYHILYKHRNFDEAKSFINELSQFLNFQKNQKALDVACGRGRHAVYMHEKGLDVIGIDLSKQSIDYANQFEEEGLKFYVHDMRTNFRKAEFDLIFNLFTSFGYFEDEQDNYKTMAALSEALKQEGKLVIDFMNTRKIVDRLIPQEEKMVDGIRFKITKQVMDNFIVKDIFFNAENKNYQFQEKVRIICKEDFLNYFNFAGLTLDKVFGDYNLNEYDQNNSDRMIFILTKN